MSTSAPHSPPRRTGPKVFLSYRRVDSYPALGLKDRLTAALGEGSVFRDDDDIRPGAPFTEAIREAVASCDVFLALISPNWLGALARLQEPGDLVRREIADALARPVTLIPLLIDGARMPTPEELPEEVRGLAALQAFPLSQRWWKEDIQRLVDAIRARDAEGSPTALPPGRPPGTRRLAGGWWAKVALAALLIAFGVAAWRSFYGPPAAVVTGGSTNSIAAGQTPSATPSPPAATQTPTPARGDSPLEQCLLRHVSVRPPRLEYGVSDWQVVIRPSEPLFDVPRGVLFTENGRPIGALLFHCVRSGTDEAGRDKAAFKIDGVLGPDCRPIQEYGSLDRPGVRDTLSNHEYLFMRLGGAQYDLRLEHKPAENVVNFQFMKKPK